MFDKDYYKGDYNYIAYCKYHFEEVNNTDLYPEKIFLFLQHVNNIHWEDLKKYNEEIITDIKKMMSTETVSFNIIKDFIENKYFTNQ